MVLISVDYMKNKYFNLYITFLPTMTAFFRNYILYTIMASFHCSSQKELVFNFNLITAYR